MKTKKIPLRKCTGCNEMKPKRELVRVVKSAEVKDEDGNIVEESHICLDLTGKKNGRGAYVCRSIECLKLARKARRFERAFSSKIPDDVYNEMEQELGSNE